MKKSLATLAKLSLTVCFLNSIAFADFKEHYDLGQTFLSQYRYPEAITEFRSALRINYLDNSARKGLINSYLAHAANLANSDRAWTKAGDNYRAALFYLKYYPSDNEVRNSAHTISLVEDNLEKCLNYSNYDENSANRFATAKRLRAEGNFPASAYEFNQALGAKEFQKESFEQIAQIMKILGNLPKSAQYYKKAVYVAPNDLNLRLEYAKILDSIKEDELALNEYSYVLEHASIENKDILYLLERTFTKKLEASPTNANLNANMGAILQKQGHLDQALTYYKQAEAYDPSNINTRINTGTLYQQKGDYRTAIKAYETVLILYPNNINANLYRAQCYEKLGETKTAQEAYKKVLALDPNNEFMKAHMLENAKKTLTIEQFIEYVKTSMADNNPEQILYDYAIQLHKNDKLDSALLVYNEALKLKKNSEIYVNIALAQAQGKNYDEAIATLNLAKNEFPNNSQIADTLKNISAMKLDFQLDNATKAYNKKDYNKAIEYYLAIEPATANTMLGIANSYQELKNSEKALEYYKKALELKPLDTDIAYAIACLYGEKEDYKNAKIYLEKAITFNQNNTNAKEFLKSINEMDNANLLNDAIALYDEGKLDESLEKFNSLLSKDSENSYALYYRGMIYDTKEKRYDAIKDLKKAYILNDEFIICEYLIASNYDALEKYKDAYTYYTKYANSNAQEDEYKEYAKARAEELKDYANK